MKSDADRNDLPRSALTVPSNTPSRSLATIELELLDAAGITSTVTSHTLRPTMGPVTHVCLSKDGSLLAVASKSLVFLFETTNWRLVGTLQGHHDIVTCTCLCTINGRLISGSRDGSLRIWDLSSLETTAVIPVNSPITCLHSLPGFERIAVGCSNGYAKVIDIDSGDSKEFTHEKAVLEVFLSDARWLATETSTCARFWDLENDLLVRRYDFPIKADGRVQFDLPRSTMSVNEGHRAVLVDIVTGRRLQEFEHADGAAIKSVYITLDGHFLATAGEDNRARLWSKNGDQLSLFPHNDWVNSVQISSDSRQVVTGSEDMTVRIWKLSGEPVKTLECGMQSVVMLQPLPDGKHLVVGGYNGAAVYSLETGQREFPLGPKEYWNGTLSINSNGQYLAASFRNGTVQIWDLKSRQAVTCLSRAGNKLYAAAITPNGKRCFTGTEEGAIFAWNLDTDPAAPNTVKEFPQAHSQWIRSIAVSPNGELLASGCWGGRVILWWPDGSIKAHCSGPGKNVYSVAFDPAGTQLASADNTGLIKIWDTAGYHQLTIATGQTQVRQVCFIGSNRVLTAGFDGTAKLWDVRTGHCEQVFSGGHDHPWVRSAVMSPDGSRVFTGGKDGAVCVYRADNGELLAKLHHLNEGFLWTTPPDEHAPSGWFWTDRADMLEIHEKADGCEVSSPVCGHKRLAYIAAFNNRIKVTSRLRDVAHHKEENFSRLLDLKHANSMAQYELKQLTVKSSSDG